MQSTFEQMFRPGTTQFPQIVEPYFKWMGSKRRLVREYSRDGLIPMGHGGTYIEPMVGSGAVYLYMRSKGAITKAILGDENPYLITTLKCIGENSQALIKLLRDIEAIYNNPNLPVGTKEDPLPVDPSMDNPRSWVSKYAMFFWFRKSLTEDYEKVSPEMTSATFLFIIASGFNALVRFNGKLKCNTPFGWRKKIKFFNKKGTLDNSVNDLMAMSRAMHGAVVQCLDYTETLKLAQPGDFVFIDPPYWPLSKTSSFTQYYRTKWTEDNFRELAQVVRSLVERSVMVMISNADLPQVHNLFDFMPIVMKYEVKRIGSCKGKSRSNPVHEVVFTNYRPRTFELLPLRI